MRRRRRPIFIFLPFAVIAIIMHFLVPQQHVPWKRLDMDGPIGLATGTKITILALAPSDVCLDTFSTAQNLKFDLSDPKHEGKTCGWDVAVDVQSLAKIGFRPQKVTGQCPLMVASYIWLNEVNRAAKKRLGSPLKRVHHAGTYSCRRQKGNSSGEWSEHAFANAWDITGFELEDGQVISVLKDWDGPRNRRKFLRDARGSACKLFRVVLTPDYNTAHKDHFHLDQGPSLSCS